MMTKTDARARLHGLEQGVYGETVIEPPTRPQIPEQPLLPEELPFPSPPPIPGDPEFPEEPALPGQPRPTEPPLPGQPPTPSGPASLRHVAGILAAVGRFVGLPYAEQFWRCYRADRTLAAHPATARSGQPVPRR